MSEIISDDQVENLKADLFEARQALFSQDIEWRSAFEVSESEKINLNTQVTLLKGEINELKNSNEIIHCALLKHMDFIKILQCEYERVRSANNFMRSKRDMALLIAEKILEGETFFSIREVAKENVTEINGSCVVLTLEEYEKNMRDQFKRGLDSGNGMMPARSLK